MEKKHLLPNDGVLHFLKIASFVLAHARITHGGACAKLVSRRLQSRLLARKTEPLPQETNDSATLQFIALHGRL
jgi:hypothetical protein